MTSLLDPPRPLGPNDVPRFPRRLRWLAEHPYLVVAVVALTVRVVFAVVSFTVNRYLIPDEQQYVELAATVARGKSAESWFTFFGQHLYDTTWPYTGVVRFLFDVFWPSRLFAQLYPAVAATGVAVLTVVLARRLVSPFFAGLAGLIVALLPSQVLWSSVALREAIVWFCLVGLAVLCALALERRDAMGLVAIAAGIAVLLVGLYHLRNQTLVAALWALIIAAWFGSKQQRLVRGAAGLVLGVGLPILFGMGPAAVKYVTDNASTISERRTYLALSADSGVTDVTVLPPSSATVPGPNPNKPRQQVVTSKGKGIVVPGYFGDAYLAEETTGATLHHLPRGLLATLVRPFPWEHSRNTGVLVARVENVAWYALYVLAIAGAWLSRRKAAIAFPVLLTGGIIAIAGVSQGNVGTAFRHRAQILWVLAVLAVVPLERLYLRRAGRSAGEGDDLDGVPA